MRKVILRLTLFIVLIIVVLISFDATISGLVIPFLIVIFSVVSVSGDHNEGGDFK